MTEPRHILLVDDEAIAIMALEHGLTDEGFRVTTAFNGQEALKIWQDDGFDALVTDLRMPVMAGDELIRHVRTDEPALPVVVVSGYATGEISEKLKASFSGPIAIMPKPVRAEEISVTLKRMLSIVPGA